MKKARQVNGIAPKNSLERSAQRIITAQFREMMSFKDGAIDGTDIEFVHDLRVSSRRLRAAMQNFADCFPQKKKFRRYLKQVSNITETMGAVRDLDVLIHCFQQAIQTLSEQEQVGVGNLIKHLQQKREEARQPMLEMFAKLDKDGFDKQFSKFFKVS
jgi:CHAD domain-containing protein